MSEVCMDRKNAPALQLSVCLSPSLIFVFFKKKKNSLPQRAVLHQPVTVARVTSLLGVAFTAIASLVISTVSRIVRQSTDGSASGIHED